MFLFDNEDDVEREKVCTLFCKLFVVVFFMPDFCRITIRTMSVYVLIHTNKQTLNKKKIIRKSG